MKRIYLIVIFLIIVSSCQKASDCFLGAGKEVVIEQNLSNFDSLAVSGVFDVHLIQDTVNQISIKGNKKFAESVTFNISGNTLVLKNEHKCKFSKPEKNKVVIYLKVKKISKIRLGVSSKLFSDNTLENDNEIGLVASSKYNEADLKLNCKTFYFWNIHLNGGKIKLSGQVEMLKLWNTSLNSVDAKDLRAKNVLVSNNSKADCTVRVIENLDCTIKNTGNVYYYGNDITVNFKDTLGSGKLVWLGN